MDDTPPKKKRDDVTHRLRKRKRAVAAPEGYYTRSVLRDKLGVTEAQIRSLVAHNVVESEGTNADGYAIYSDKQLQRLLDRKADGTLFRRVREFSAAAEDASSVGTTYTAEQGVRVFELLHEEKTLEQIILTTKFHPLVVKRVQQDYDEIAGSIMLPKRIVDKMNAIDNLPGSFPLKDGTSVLEVLELSAEARLCSECHRFESIGLCDVCIANMRRRERRAAEGEANGGVLEGEKASRPGEAVKG